MSHDIGEVVRSQRPYDRCAAPDIYLLAAAERRASDATERSVGGRCYLPGRHLPAAARLSRDCTGLKTQEGAALLALPDADGWTRIAIGEAGLTEDGVLKTDTSDRK